MKFFSHSIMVALLPLVSPIFAAPTSGPLPSGLKTRDITRDEILARLNPSLASSNDDLIKRTPGNVFLCTGANWSGTCQVLEFELDEEQSDSCFAIPAPFFQNVGSIGPDPGALCFLSTTNQCRTQDDLQIASPGLADMWNVDGTNWGSFAQAMQCTQCTSCN